MKAQIRNLGIRTSGLLLIAAVAAACNSSDGSAPSASGGASCHANAQARTVAKLVAARTAQPMSHLPHALQRFSDQGKFSEAQQLPVAVSLQLNNEAELEQKVAEMYTPGTAGYGHFMTPSEFKARYAPTQDQVSQVQQYLASNGVQGVSVNENGYMITGKASVRSLNSMLQTEIHQYKDAKGQSYFAPKSEPVIPPGMGIQAIHGLHNISKWHSYAVPAIPNAASANPAQGTGKSGSGHSGGFSAADVRGNYDMNISGVDGSGQTLALFELDAYNQSDLTAYEQYNNLPNVPVSAIDVDRGSTSNPGGGQAEVTLDIELMMAVAPGAKILVYEGANSDAGILATYAKIANDNIAKSVSSSWGSSEDGTSSSTIQAENTIFMQMAAQGQSIFSAAGDSGAKDNGSSLSIDDPSGQPYMTAVGGTTLTANGGTYGSESTWSGGGGGVSSVWKIPGYQQGVANGSNKASSTMRNIPDVSLNADMQTGYDIYQAGGWGSWGGTSCSAPIWAAYIALINQQRQAAGMGTIGFINPYLYAIGNGASYHNDFRDIADGSTNGYYPAVSGFDDATGWGTPIGTNLFQDLTSGAAGTPPAPGATIGGCS